MTMPFPPSRLFARAVPPRRSPSRLVAAWLLAGCDKNKDKPATQTAAKVNKEEITVHQINYRPRPAARHSARAGGLGEPRRSSSA